jgi:phage FluMu protein Com
MNNIPPYLVSYACFTCRKVFKRHYDPNILEMKCPNCGEISQNVGRNFRARKRGNKNQWEKIEFLVSNGFRFQSIYVDGKRISYPDTLEEAKLFVEKYKDKAIVK